MAFKIPKQDTRPNVTVSVSISASLYEDLAALAGATENNIKYVAVEALKGACRENQTAIDKWKAENKPKLDAALKSARTRASAQQTSRKSLTAIA